MDESSWAPSVPWLLLIGLGVGLLTALISNLFQVSIRRAKRLRLIEQTYHVLLEDLTIQYNRTRQELQHERSLRRLERCNE